MGVIVSSIKTQELIHLMGSEYEHFSAFILALPSGCLDIESLSRVGNLLQVQTVVGLFSIEIEGESFEKLVSQGGLSQQLRLTLLERGEVSLTVDDLSVRGHLVHISDLSERAKSVTDNVPIVPSVVYACDRDFLFNPRHKKSVDKLIKGRTAIGVVSVDCIGDLPLVWELSVSELESMLVYRHSQTPDSLSVQFLQSLLSELQGAGTFAKLIFAMIARVFDAYQDDLDQIRFELSRVPVQCYFKHATEFRTGRLRQLGTKQVVFSNIHLRPAFTVGEGTNELPSRFLPDDLYIDYRDDGNINRSAIHTLYLTIGEADHFRDSLIEASASRQMPLTWDADHGTFNALLDFICQNRESAFPACERVTDSTDKDILWRWYTKPSLNVDTAVLLSCPGTAALVKSIFSHIPDLTIAHRTAETLRWQDHLRLFQLATDASLCDNAFEYNRMGGITGISASGETFIELAVSQAMWGYAVCVVGPEEISGVPGWTSADLISPFGQLLDHPSVQSLSAARIKVFPYKHLRDGTDLSDYDIGFIFQPKIDSTVIQSLAARFYVGVSDLSFARSHDGSDVGWTDVRVQQVCDLYVRGELRRACAAFFPPPYKVNRDHPIRQVVLLSGSPIFEQGVPVSRFGFDAVLSEGFDFVKLSGTPSLTTSAETMRAATLHTQGRSLREIGQELGMSHTTVARHLAEAGITLRKTTTLEKVVAYVNAQGIPVSTAEVVGAIGGSERSVKSALQQAVRQDLIVRSGHGIYERVSSHS